MAPYKTGKKGFKELKSHSQTTWRTLTLRPTERGQLTARFARWPVWTVRADGSVRKEWLLMRGAKNKTAYSLSNAAPTVSLLTMAKRKSQRHFIECSNRDAKSELGWDEFQAIKYRAWEHHHHHHHHHQADTLPRTLGMELDVLPALSMTNVREMLRAAMPLPQLSPLQAAQLVAKHLDNRARSRKSRLRKALSP